jgi:hypothetical protein
VETGKRHPIRTERNVTARLFERDAACLVVAGSFPRGHGR